MDSGASSGPPQCAYESYQVTNDTAGTLPDVWAKIDGFASANVGVAPLDDGLSHLGQLNAGQSKMAFFYVCGTPTAAATITYTVSAYLGPPASTPLYFSQAMSFTAAAGGAIQNTIQAASNKVTAVFSGPKPPTLGGTATLTVEGDTGNIGGDNLLVFNPAAFWNWPASTFELIQSQVFFAATSVTFTNQLAIVYASTSAYVATYQFRAMATTVTNTAASPVNYINSGTQMKHTNLSSGVYGGTGTFDPISPPSNTLTLSATATTYAVLYPGTSTVTIRVTNSGPNSADLDGFRLSYAGSPAQPLPVSGTSAFDGAGIPNPVTLPGSVIAWDGIYSIPAGGFRDLTFQVGFTNTAGTYNFDFTALIGSIIIDTTLNTADSAPSSFSIAVNLPTPTPTISPSFTPSPLVTATFTPSSTSTETPSSSATPSGTPTATPTYTATPSCRPLIYAVSSRSASGALGASDDVVMVYNACGFCSDISGYQIRELTGGGCAASVRYTFPPGTVMSPASYRLIVTAGFQTGNWGGTDTPDDSAMLNFGNDSGIELYDPGFPGATADLVGLGASTCREGSANAPGTAAGEVVYRAPLPGTDSGDNGADFSVGLASAFNLINGQGDVCGTPTVTPTWSGTATPSSTVTPSSSATPSVTPTWSSTSTITPSATPTDSSTSSITPTWSSTSTVSPGNSPTFTATSSITPTWSSTSTSTPSVTPTDSSTSTITPSVTPTHSSTSTVTPTWSSTSTITPSVTETSSATPTSTDSPSSTSTVTESHTASPLASATNSPSITPTWSVTETSTPSATPTFTPSSTSTVTPSVTETSADTPSSTPTVTESHTASATGTGTPSASPSWTPSPLASDTASPSITPTWSVTETSTSSATPTFTQTSSPTATPSATETSTGTPSATPTVTETYTAVATDTGTGTPSPSNTSSATETASPTSTATPSATESWTASPAFTATSSPVPSATFSASASPSATPSITSTQTPATPVLTSLDRASGLTTGGYPLVLTGSDFQCVATVTFGALTATVVSCSATSITVVVPPQGPGPVNVVVTNPGGFSSTALVFTYLDPTPTPSDLTGTLGPVPSKPGAPVCFYCSNSLAYSEWTVFGLDQQIVARLRFDTAGRHCFTATRGLAPGNYLVKIKAVDIHGRTAYFTRRIMIER